LNLNVYNDGTDTLGGAVPDAIERAAGNEGLPEELVSFADEVGLFYEDIGLPRAWGRVLGWLLVCEPDFQSAEDFANVLHGSRGSVSMTTQALIRGGMVERRTFRGDRRTYYRIRPDSWTAVLEDQQRSTKRLRTLAERGLELLKDQPPERRHRLEQLHSLMAFFERELPALIDEWRRQRDSERQ
jgi:DNA-binding transcriptional regulator GbsR (MarR family)